MAESINLLKQCSIATLLMTVTVGLFGTFTVYLVWSSLGEAKRDTKTTIDVIVVIIDK